MTAPKQSTSPTQRRQPTIDDLVLQMAAGASPADVKMALISSGSHESAADNIVTAIAAQRGAILKEEKWEDAKNHLIWGSLWAGGGGLLTLFTYLSASSNPAGGTYYVFWGALGYGAIRLLIGIGAFLESR